MAIITLSRQVGSLGDEIASAAADTLGYEFIEKAQISKALSSSGFSISDIDKYDEKKPSVWQTLSIQKDQFALLIRAAVYGLAAKRNVVIVGRGAQVILKDVPGALHVRVIAPSATRVNRLMEQRGYEKKTAQRIIRQSDHDSSGYLRTYFDASWNDSDLYDLVINTRKVTLKESVEMITCAVGTDEIKKSPHVSTVLHDLALSHKAKSALLKVTGEVGYTDLEFEKGVAVLSGLVDSPAIKNECEKIILNIQGIESVNNQLNVRDNSTIVF